MNRRNFLKNIGLGTTAIMVTPKLLEISFENNSELLNQETLVSLENEREFTAIISNKTDFLFNKEHQLRAGDTIYVYCTETLQALYVVTEIKDDKKLKAICAKKNTAIWGEVDILKVSNA